MLRLNGKEYPYRLQDVRHTLFVMHSFFAGIHDIGGEAVSLVTRYVSAMKSGNYETYGTVINDQGKPITAEETQLPGLAAWLACLLCVAVSWSGHPTSHGPQI